MRRLILGTAGHIDHGKTALVRALTGIDTDRLPEEKRRGITIDIGFAQLPLNEQCELSIVDVPGHEAFVRNMLAGATGIDMVLLVIAADEGVMPQTREHLAIVELLGIRRGVVAITKTDLVDDDWLELIRDDVAQLLGPTPLADAPSVAVSARTGAGLDQLRVAIDDVARKVPVRRTDDLFRMPIDRVFTVRGTGTVITGTVWSGTLRRDEHVRIEPAGVTARVRAMQRHGSDTDAVGPGERAALALVGTDRQAIGRGDTAVAGAGWMAGRILTVRLTAVREETAAVRPRQRVRVHLGTAEVLARVGLLPGELTAGQTAIVQLRLESPLIARAGDHVVIRSYSPVHTIAGGVVLEPNAPKRKRLTSAATAALRDVLLPDEAPGAALLLAAASIPIHSLPILTGLPPADAEAAAQADSRLTRVGDRLVDASRLAACRAELLEHVRRFHAARPLEDGTEREALRRLVHFDLELVDIALQQLLQAQLLTSRGAAIADPTAVPTPSADDRLVLDRLCGIFATAGLQAPTADELPPDLAADPRMPLLLRFLEREGTLVKMAAGRWIAAAAASEAVLAVRTQMAVGQPLDVADFRTVLGLSRKHLIPLLEYLDRVGVTSRRGDSRQIEPATPAAPYPIGPEAASPES